MKKITAFLGLMGVVSMISGCTDAGSDVIGVEDELAWFDSSDSVASSASSESKKQETPQSSVSGQASSSASQTPDTVTIDQHVYLSASSNYTPPYYSNGVFCWDNSKECKSTVTSSSSSSYSLEVTISSEAPVYPTVTDTQMTDMRDQQTYKLQTIAGVHWMAENLKYATSDGSFCSVEGGEDMCVKYGRYYSSAASKRACPTGWRLPTLSEVQAADAAVEQSWWQIGGRFKIEDGSSKANEFGLADEQGYIWIEADDQYNSFRIKNYSDSDVHEPQASEAGRAYNVRCVENK